MELLHANRQKPILVTAPGSVPLQEFMVRKLLVLGYCAIGSNSYEVYESGALNAGLVIAISKSGKTGTILKPVQDSLHSTGASLLVGARQFSHRPLCRPCLCAAGRQDADDRTLPPTISMRVLITFEYLCGSCSEKDEHPNGKEGQ